MIDRHKMIVSYKNNNNNNDRENCDCRIMMSGSSTKRKELIHDLRETSLIGGNAILKREVVDKAVQRREMVDKSIQREEMVDKAIQCRGTMDLGSGDNSDNIFVSDENQTDDDDDDGIYNNNNNNKFLEHYQ